MDVVGSETTYNRPNLVPLMPWKLGETLYLHISLASRFDPSCPSLASEDAMAQRAGRCVLRSVG